MNNVKKKLIREVIFKLLEQDTKFSEGDQIKDQEGREGVVVLSKHPYYSITLDETGVTKTYHYTDLIKIESNFEKYDTTDAPDLEESSNEDLVHLDGLLVIKDGEKLTEILSDIRSINGVTIVRTEDIPGDSRKTKVFIKIDPFPMGDKSNEDIRDIIKLSIRRIPGVRELWTQPPSPISEIKYELKFRIKEDL